MGERAYTQSRVHPPPANSPNTKMDVLYIVDAMTFDGARIGNPVRKKYIAIAERGAGTKRSSF